jgi:hypothetical protein
VLGLGLGSSDFVGALGVKGNLFILKIIFKKITKSIYDLRERGICGRGICGRGI